MYSLGSLSNVYTLRRLATIALILRRSVIGRVNGRLVIIDSDISLGVRGSRVSCLFLALLIVFFSESKSSLIGIIANPARYIVYQAIS